VAISAAIHWRKLCGSVPILPLRLLRYIYFEDEPDRTHGPNCSPATRPESDYNGLFVADERGAHDLTGVSESVRDQDSIRNSWATYLMRFSPQSRMA
jgi:hypothetical protein